MAAQTKSLKRTYVTDKEEGRQYILDAAAQTISVLGVEEASIDEIARAMEATKGKIYYYFKTKREIVLEIWKQSVLLTIDGAASVDDMEADPRIKLFELGYSHARTMMQNKSVHKVAIECMRRPPLTVSSASERRLAGEIRELQDKYEDMFRQVLAEGLKGGQFREGSLSVYLHSVITMLHSPVYWYSVPKTRIEANRHEIATQLGNMAVASVCGPVVRDA